MGRIVDRRTAVRLACVTYTHFVMFVDYVEILEVFSRFSRDINIGMFVWFDLWVFVRSSGASCLHVLLAC